jgi:predicted O-methyltransferase YrrM
MFQLIRAWIRRAGGVRRERAALRGLPTATLDVANLRAISKADVEEAFSSHGAIAVEWSEVSSLIDRIALIEDMTTAGVNPGDRHAVYYLIRALRPRRVLEIGTNVGASTLHIAAAMKRNNEDGKGECTLVTVDIADVNDPSNGFWKQAGLPCSPRDNMAQLGMAGCVEFVVADSLSYFDRHADRYDFIFLDGDHAASTVYQELPRALKHLRAGGTILLHDFFPRQRPLWSNGAVVPGPSLAMERYQEEGAKARVLPLGALPWPTKLGSNVTSLALLTQ